LLPPDRSRAWEALAPTGAHHAPLAGIAPTNVHVKFSGVSIYRFDNGRIVESWYVYDLFGLLSPLGAIPDPANA
jgi:predicted ester cyclase